ncbi:MAG: cardiolipin synthase [Lachnospiraceae bacterium]|uniref:cardiolipin synthase n=1 Tax=Candidatus Merdisoma sp. JLR.KK006 TaxID=3112626 RepID=UPI002FF31A76|nr:cardiolipin synthase [Lachnospiraceae bacterium]
MLRKILKLLTSRLVFFGILLLLQLVWFLTFLTRLLTYSTAISIIFTVLSLLAVLWIIHRGENPAYQMAWIIFILVFPLLGGLFYLFVGNKQPSKKMRRKLEAEQKRTKEALIQEEAVLKGVQQTDARMKGQFAYMSQTCGFPVYRNTQASYFSLGDELFPKLLEELKKAEHFIFMEYFIVEKGRMWDSILEILEEKAAAGLDVRFLYDDLGSVSLLPPGYDRQLEAKGIRCMAFNPFIPLWSLVMNNRDHRKITVIDGHTAFSGGVNLADEYINEKMRFGHWKDTGFMLKGEAVWNYTVMFLQMWNAFRKTDVSYEAFRPKCYHPEPFESDGFVQPYGDSPLDDEIAAENVYLNILNQARDYVYIFTPYLIIDHEMDTALRLAAKRGVDVRIVTPGIPDKKVIFQLTRSYYPSLLKDGVHIYEYTPGFLHAKSYVCDDETAVVGTINMDFRSLYLHFECGTLFYRNSIVADVKQDCLQTIEQSREIQLRDTRQGFFGSLFCAVLRVLAPLL